MTEEAKMILEKIADMGGQINHRLDGMDERFDGIDKRLDGMDERFDGIDKQMDSVDERLDKMDKNMGRMNEEITDIQLTLENETNRNIRIIAEGHLDLNRKIMEALKIEEEREMLLLRISTLENNVRKIRKQMSATA